MSSEQPPTTEKLSFDELKKLDAYFDQQLNTPAEETKQEKKFSFKKLFLWVAGILVSVLFPFIVLVRGSLYVHTSYGVNGWIALLAGVLATCLLLMGYALVVNYAFTKSFRVHKYIRRGIIALVIAYCGYGLLYLSSMNAKNAEVQSYYSSLHPILRVSLSTIILADGDLVITDLQRSAEDYEAMGLPVNNYSKHFPQDGGYVHAADIRTKGRAEWKNWITEKTFQLLGFKTLRHVGTADHLHVSLPQKN